MMEAMPPPSASADRPKPRRAACTIIAKNYLAYARTLAESFLAYHPDAAFYVLVVDDIDGFFEPCAEPFEVLTARQLGIADFERMAFKYDIVEFSTAVKPFLLERLLVEHGHAEVLYIDPDILVLNPLDALFAFLQHHDIVLTPHTTVDFPNDHQSPNDAMLMIHGLYNLGFIAVRASANTYRFLHWWQEKLRDRCVIEPCRGYFVDQKFIDLVPLFFAGVHVANGCGFNVAYWNLHARQLHCDNGKWLCNGEPLVFYHFSGFNPDEPDWLCRHSLRYTMSNRPDVAPLFADYIARVRRHGHAVCSRWPYTFASFSEGTRILKEFRGLFRSGPHGKAEPAFATTTPFSSRLLLKHYKRWHFCFTKPIRRLPMRVVRSVRRRLSNLLRPRTADMVS
jgi:hypothetical protein